MKGKTFMNSKGDIVRVSKIDGNYVILEDGERVSINKMLDNNSFQEINESSNINYNNNDDAFAIMNRSNDSLYNSIASQLNSALRNTNTNMMSDNSAGASVKVLDNVVERHRSTNNDILIDNADNNIQDLRTRMVEDQRKMNEKLNKQNQQFSKWLDDESNSDDVRDSSVKMYDENDRLTDSITSNITQKPEFKEDPAHAMFRSLKKSVPIEIDITISEMLPKREFIQMWEESYEVSIINFLADEFVRKYANNPLLMKGIIVERIKEYAYGKPTIDNSDKETTKPIKKRTNNKKTNPKS